MYKLGLGSTGAKRCQRQSNFLYRGLLVKRFGLHAINATMEITPPFKLKYPYPDRFTCHKVQALAVCGVWCVALVLAMPLARGSRLATNQA